MAHITAHGAPIQLPEGPQSQTAQHRMAPPKLTDQILGIQAMPLEPTAHGKPSQRNRSSDNFIHRALKVIQTPWSGVNLQGVRAQLLQHGAKVLKTDTMIRCCDQAERAGG